MAHTLRSATVAHITWSSSLYLEPPRHIQFYEVDAAHQNEIYEHMDEIKTFQLWDL